MEQQFEKGRGKRRINDIQTTNISLLHKQINGCCIVHPLPVCVCMRLLCIVYQILFEMIEICCDFRLLAYTDFMRAVVL